MFLRFSKKSLTIGHMTLKHLRKQLGNNQKIADFFGITIQSVGTWKKAVPKRREYELYLRLPEVFPYPNKEANHGR